LALLPAIAQADDTLAAKAKYASGVRHFDLSEYDNALADFKDAYRNKPDPVFLYNIAQCHRKLGHTDEAITFYQSYLRRAPEARNREEVERRIKDLESLRDAQSASVVTSAGIKPQPRAVSAEAGENAVTVATTPPPVAALDFRASPPDTTEPGSGFYTRWWFWTAIGTVAAGTATLVVIMTRRDPTKLPSSDLGSQKALP
jgi:tetratricopeptide (TPR) repeat protein